MLKFETWWSCCDWRRWFQHKRRSVSLIFLIERITSQSCRMPKNYWWGFKKLICWSKFRFRYCMQNLRRMYWFGNGWYSIFKEILSLHQVNGQISFTHSFRMCLADQTYLYFYRIINCRKEQIVERSCRLIDWNYNQKSIKWKKLWCCSCTLRPCRIRPRNKYFDKRD